MKGFLWLACGMAAILEVNLISIRRNTSPRRCCVYLLSLFIKAIHRYHSEPVSPDEIELFY